MFYIYYFTDFLGYFTPLIRGFLLPCLLVLVNNVCVYPVKVVFKRLLSAIWLFLAYFYNDITMRVE